MKNPVTTFRNKLLYYVVFSATLFNFIGYPAYAIWLHKPVLSFYSPYSRYFTIPEYARVTEVDVKKTGTGKKYAEDEKHSTSYKPGVYKETVSVTEFISKDKKGIIGYEEQNKSDDPADNIFELDVDKSALENKELVLRYEVFGIENVSGISRSINYGNAKGGYFIKRNSRWQAFEERISASELRQGVNQILFTVPENIRLSYQVRNLSLLAYDKGIKPLVEFIDGDILYTQGNQSYLKGTVARSDANLFLNNKPVALNNGQFETMLENVASLSEIEVELRDGEENILYKKTHKIKKKEEAGYKVSFTAPYTIHKIEEDEEGKYSFNLEDVDLTVYDKDYGNASAITVQKLRNTEIVPLGTDIINVTGGKSAFRFFPEGAKFDSLAKLTIKYDKALLPKGYSEEEIRVLYFDIDKRKWVAIKTDSIHKEEQRIVALTDHFTDYIAGIIQAPDSPETNSFTPTSITDIKVADPTANIMQVQPPSANQKGDGTTDFPIALPPGRNGMQPSLSVSYNNNGGSGTAGYGWEIPVQYITVDTRFGVPEYNTTRETESYLLNGEELMLKNGNELYLPHRNASDILRITNGVFYPKVEGSFTKIQRLGSGPQDYSWIILDKAGMKYYYGTTAAGRFSSGTGSGNIAKWMLQKVEDKNGNYIQYEYTIRSYSGGNTAGGKEILISAIRYTLHPETNGSQTGYHSVNFLYNSNQRSDQTVSYRYGFKEVNAASLDKINVSSTMYKEGETYGVQYKFNYTTGKFGKQLLTSVETKNTRTTPYEGITDTQVYTHTFDYYNDIQAGLFGAERTINAEDDFNKKLSVIGGTIEKDEVTGNVDFGIGIFSPVNPNSYVPISYSGTVNFTIPIPNKVKIKPSVSLLDVDGDGLPDKVIKLGDEKFRFRKNLGGYQFSSQLYDMIHFKEISSIESRTSSEISPSVSILLGNKSFSNSTTVSESNIFLTDANADGLVDFVKDKIVYFNRLDPNSGLPTFTENSALTPNRIFKEGDVDAGVLAPLPDLTIGNDLMDAVKVWVAPKKGKINITGTITKQFVSTENGIRYSIEHSGLQLWPGGTPVNTGLGGAASSVPIGPIDPIDLFPTRYIQTPSLLVVNSAPTNFSNVEVNEGDMIFFRVNNSQIPVALAKVNWDPQITYTEQDFDSPNQYKQYSSKYSDTFIYGNTFAEPYVFKENGTYRLIWDNFSINNSGTVAELSDDVEIRAVVYKSNTANSDNNPEQVLNQYSFKIKRNQLNSLNNPSQLINVTGVNPNNPESFVYLRLEVNTTSQIDWKKLDGKFKPSVFYVEKNESTPVIPGYKVYRKQITSYYKSVFNAQTMLNVRHNFTLASCDQASCKDQLVYLVVKNQYGKIPMDTNGRPVKFSYKISSSGTVAEIKQYDGNGFNISVNISAVTQFTVPGGTSLYFEYYAETPGIASRLKKYQNDYNNLITTSAGAVPKSDYVNNGSNTGLFKANIFYAQNLTGFGTLFRNWGQFAYKGAAPLEDFSTVKRKYLGINKLAGFEEEEITQSEAESQEAFVNNTDVEEMEYDYETGALTDGNGGQVSGINLNQLEAMRHFTMMKPDRKMSSWKVHSRLFVKSSEMSPYFRYDIDGNIASMQIPDPQLNTLNGAVSIIKQSVSRSKGDSFSVGIGSLSIGNSKTEAETVILNDYQDVNGDGYPDILGTQVQLTSKRGGLSAKKLNHNLLFRSTTTGSGKALSGSKSTVLVNILNSKTDIRIGDHTSGTPSLGGNSLTTYTESEGVLLDINGDGLADKVLVDGNVQFNNGVGGFTGTTFTGFSKPSYTKTKLAGLSASMGDGFSNPIGDYDADMPNSDAANFGASSNLDYSIGVSGSRSATMVLQDFMDLNGDGLPDYINAGSVYFNTGTSFVSGGAALPKLTESNVAQIGLSVNLSFNVLIPLGLIIPIGLKIGAGGGANLSNTYSQDVTRYIDFDGDGYLDMVHSTDEESLTVRLSAIGRTNMLKKIHNPTGSVVEMDYATRNVVSGTGFGNDYRMPFKKWVLSRVKVHDGFASDGEDIQHFAFEYKNGFKDRRERKFLGFGEVKTHELLADGSVYRTLTKEYMLNNMPQSEWFLTGAHSDNRKYQYTSGLLTKETLTDGADRVLNTTTYDYALYALGAQDPSGNFDTGTVPSFLYTDNSRVLPLIKENKVTARHFSGNSTTDFIDVENRYTFSTYDRYGNVLKYVDHTDGVNVSIDYHIVNASSQYRVNIPKTHTVTSSGNVLRKSSTDIDNSGNVTGITRFKTFDGPGEAVTNFKFDGLGNVIMVIYPKPKASSQESERFFRKYEYDPLFRQFVRTVTDAYGYSSSSEMVNFGMPVGQTDLNGVEFTYRYDGLRRLKEFKGPYNGEWTIRNSYKTAINGLKYAVTAHNILDEQDVQTQPGQEKILYTSSFADGLGRIVQTKKQLDTREGCPGWNGQDGYRFAVSGNVVYDELGRVTESYLSQEEKDCLGSFMQKLETYTHLTHTDEEKTSFFYDSQDRILQSHVHGLNATTSYYYGYGDGYALEKVTLPEGNVSRVFKDYKGRVVVSEQVDEVQGQTLQTRYKYDVLGQLLTVTDAEGLSTNYQYDSFGQKTETSHPDNGTSVFTYDLTGKLVASRNQNLINNGQEVTYEYSFNQLQKIQYPSHKVTYKYGAAGSPDFAAGRILEISDLTGGRVFKYGPLGEVTEDIRFLQSQSGGTMQFTTRNRFDSWGRIMEMEYPDGEHLKYKYNGVGQLLSIYNTVGDKYLNNVFYNFFEQPETIEYGNGVVTRNEYDITQRIRAVQLDRPDQNTFMRNVYTYDRNQNIRRIENNYSQHQVIKMGGVFAKDYSYDGFNRLRGAKGSWKGFQEGHDYQLEMRYNQTHGIVNKNQFHTTSTPVFSGETENSYLSMYHYKDPDHPHAVSGISYTDHSGNNIGNTDFKYDANGNMMYVSNSNGQINWGMREMIWDEQNRLMAVIDEGQKVSHYVYDHSGERTFKSEGSITQVNIGGQNIYSALNFDDYIVYPSGYMAVNQGRNQASKHYYINNKRFASRLVKLEGWVYPQAQATGFSSAGKDTVQNAAADSAGINDVMKKSTTGIAYNTYSTAVGNTPANCTAQLQTLLNLYDTTDTQHCRNYIQQAMNTMTPCDALVLVNQYVCIPYPPGTPIDPETGLPQNNPDDTTPPGYSEGEMEEFDCLTALNVLIVEYTAMVQQPGNGSYSMMTTGTNQDYLDCLIRCKDECARISEQTGIWPADCNDLETRCGCSEDGGSNPGGGNDGGGDGSGNPVGGDVKCAMEALKYIEEHLVFEPQMNACEVYYYVLEHYKCKVRPGTPQDPEAQEELPDDWTDGGGNDGDSEEEYDEAQRQPVWWYHTDHLGSSTYLTDNFGRPSHYYETLPFGEMMVEHNQSTSPLGKYDNVYKFNGKELDDATQMYYYGARYYDPRISIFVNVDPLAEKTMEPYSYCGNSPVTNLEIDGRFWWKASDKKMADKLRAEYNSNLKGLNTKLENLNSQLGKTTDIGKQRELGVEIALINDKISANNKGISNLDKLESSKDFGFTFQKKNKGDMALLEFGGMENHDTYGNKAKIIINYLSNSNATHEANHAKDVVDGKLIPGDKGYNFNYYPDQHSMLQGEVDSYQIEFGIYGIPKEANSDVTLPVRSGLLEGKHVKGMYWKDQKGVKQYPYKDLE